MRQGTCDRLTFPASLMVPVMMFLRKFCYSK